MSIPEIRSEIIELLPDRSTSSIDAVLNRHKGYFHKIHHFNEPLYTTETVLRIRKNKLVVWL